MDIMLPLIIMVVPQVADLGVLDLPDHLHQEATTTTITTIITTQAEGTVTITA